MAKLSKKTSGKKTSAKSEDLDQEFVDELRSMGADTPVCLLGSDEQLLRIRGVIPMGCATAEDAIGRGGIPLGRLTVLMGGEGGGKTTMALHICAETQKAGGQVVYLDKEYKMDPDWAAAIGVDTSKLIIAQPSSLESVLTLIKNVVVVASKRRARGKEGPILIVLDSMNACKGKAVLEGEEGQSHMAVEARIWSEHIPGIIEMCNKENVALLFISQVRKKLGVMFGNDETMGGGNTVKFYASCIGYLRRIANVKKEGGPVTGVQVEIEWKKNQISAPFRRGKFFINFPPHPRPGIDSVRALIDLGLKRDVLAQKGANLVWGEEVIAAGFEKSASALVKANRLGELAEAIAESKKKK